MTDFKNIVIEPLNDGHDRSDFNCEVESLNRYIKKQAGQDIKRRISRVFVATPATPPGKVIGYYSLSALSIELFQLPEKMARKLPRHPLPAALIGRLAVSKDAQGEGFGKMLLADAIKRTIFISDQIAIHAMVVDAVDENAKRFYEQYGFRSFCENGPRLFLPLKSIPKL
jgi:GNAT superfamily N-acetyltransferase